MVRYLVFSFFQVFTFFFCYMESCGQSILEKVIRTVHDEQLRDFDNVSGLDKQIAEYLSGLDKNTGQWTEFDYKDHKRINPSWIPVLERMRLMTLAYTHPESVYFRDKDLYKAVSNSLYFFTSQKPLPYCDNWYIQGITRPQLLTKCLINMQLSAEGLNTETKRNLIDAICLDTALNSPGRNNPNHKYNFGANKAQIAKGWVIIGAILEDRNMLEIGVKEVYAPIQRTTGEGIQHDLSYDMHYGYLYNGSYGVDFMQSVVETAYIMKDSPYALTGEKLVLFRNFINESIFGLMRGPFIDWNILGRGISRINATKKDLSVILDKLIALDPAAGEQYRIIQRRISSLNTPWFDIIPSHRHYWKTDYTVHKRPAYTFSIHAVSNRNYSQEIGNQENLMGYWGAQGTTNLQLEGNEYYNIFPIWNWARLPGTTLPDSIPLLENKAPGTGDRRGTSSFSGGVSDSLYGATAYVVENDLGTSYKKSWFMFDHTIICLGAGIKSELSVPLNTTLNQCLLGNGDVLIKKRRSKAINKFSGEKYIDDIESIWHNRVGYFFPSAQSVDLRIEERSGDWRTIRSSQENENRESKSVFQLGIQHGIKPNNASYAYILLPGIDNAEDIARFRENSAIKIVYNTENLQAVNDIELGIWQMIFYDSATNYEDENILIKTDIPSIIMLKKVGDSAYELFVSDPNQTYKKACVSVLFKKKGQFKHSEIDLPSSPYAGQSKHLSLEL